jgi:hypothetical protein
LAGRSILFFLVADSILAIIFEKGRRGNLEELLKLENSLVHSGRREPHL